MSDKKLLERIDKRFRAMSDAENDARVARLERLKFVRLGEQWPEAVKRDRETPGQERPCLTINRILQFRQQIVNESRQMRPSLMTRPVGDGADLDTSEIYNGVLRHIQEASDASVAYDTAAENQIDTGLGYFSVTTDYADNDSFNQEIKIVREHDIFRIFFDEMSTEPDGSDARDAIKLQEWAIEDFKAEYPGVEPISAKLDGITSWVDEKTVKVAQYYYLDITDDQLCLMADGSTVLYSQLPEQFRDLIQKKRPVQHKVCKIAKRAGDEIIEETELPTSYIPIIPVYGTEVWIEGKRHLQSLTQFAEDAQRLYNYNQSANTETNALAPKTPFIGAEGQFEGHETEWNNANRINYAYLEYKPVTDELGNSSLPPPRRESPVPGNQGYELAMNRSVDDMKACMGIYDASLGNRESDQSGKAINSQRQQAAMGNMHFNDNQGRSIKHAGRIIIEMIPKIYDTARVLRIIGEDGSPKTVKIDPNQPRPVNEQTNPETGKVEKIYNLNVGKYDLAIDIGPSYATKRQQSEESMMQFIQAFPPAAQVAGDLIAKEMDWPGAQEISKRLKVMLPPQIQQEIQSEESGEEDPKTAMMMHQMADQMQHMSQIIQQLQQAPEMKRLEFEAQQKQIDWFNAETQRLKVELEAKSKDFDNIHRMAEAELAHQLATTNQGMAAQDQAHSQQIAQAQQEQAEQNEQQQAAEQTETPTQ